MYVCMYVCIYIYIYIYHGCMNCVNLEMEPKYLMKNNVKLVPNISTTKNDKRYCKKH